MPHTLHHPSAPKTHLRGGLTMTELLLTVAVAGLLGVTVLPHNQRNTIDAHIAEGRLLAQQCMDGLDALTVPQPGASKPAWQHTVPQACVEVLAPYPPTRSSVLASIYGSTAVVRAQLPVQGTGFAEPMLFGFYKDLSLPNSAWQCAVGGASVGWAGHIELLPYLPAAWGCITGN